MTELYALPQVQSMEPGNLLIVSTLDGHLHALSKLTGDLQWTLKDGEGALTPPCLHPNLRVDVPLREYTGALEYHCTIGHLCDLGTGTQLL